MRRWLVLAALVLALAPVARAGQPVLAGSWQRLPTAPEAAAIPYARAGVWTGKQLIVFGRAGTAGEMRNVAFSYDPASRRWRTLNPPAGPTGSYEGALSAVWTGRQMLVWGPAITLSYEPAANRWRQLPRSPLLGAPSGLVVWTGREMITWGGGCCGDVSKDGVAYDPAAGTWRKLAEAPIAGQQSPMGAWTGRELVVFPGRDPDGKPTGGAAYDPAKDTWRRIASPPQERLGSNVAWDGRELLVLGGSGPPDSKTGIRKLVSVPFAYDPATNRWRTLAAIDQGRYGRLAAAAVWTGKRLLLWGGETQASHRSALAPHGLAYDPKTDRWFELPGAPLLGRLSPVAVWTGKALLVWGGDPFREDVPSSSDWWPLLDGATFTPGG
jgi:N-acetylneuraminic acid mutarotase